MEEQAKYTFGVDVGTDVARAVALKINSDESISVIGYGEEENMGGMHKGVVTNLNGPAAATDRVLRQVESMSGVNVNSGYASINGAHVGSERVNGMIAVSSAQGISQDDLNRLEETAISGGITSNRVILDLIPLNYTLDGQSGIRMPIGMTANKIEMTANVISGMRPSVDALAKAMDMAQFKVLKFVPTAVAAARVVFTEKQMENGVAVIDFGASTTSIAIYDEGDLQYIGVVNAGSNNITKDLAISLRTNTEIAEEIKLKHVTADFIESDKELVMRHGGETVNFSKNEVNEIVRDRLIDIFEHVNKHLMAAGYAQKLPEGVVIVGAGAKLKGIAGFAKEILKMAVKIGVFEEKLKGLIEEIERPEFATALGLALMMADEGRFANENANENKKTFSLFGFLKKK